MHQTRGSVSSIARIEQVQREVRLPFAGLDLIGANIGIFVEPETQDVYAFDEMTSNMKSTHHPHLEPQSVGRVSPEQYLRLGMGNTFDRAKTLEMCGSSVCDYDDVGFGQRCQVRNFASMVGTHFENCELM